MKFMRFAVLATATLFVAACLPVTTKNPVGTTVGFKADPALVGVWKGRGEPGQGDTYMAFLNGRNGTMTALMFFPDEKNGEWDAYTLRAALLGKNHIMNASFAHSSGAQVSAEKAKMTFPLLYEIRKNGSLALALLDEKKMKDAIRSGKIEGKIDPGETGDVHITADPKHLDAFFATKESTAFFAKKFAVMHRVN